jgi:hypothetical protein
MTNASRGVQVGALCTLILLVAVASFLAGAWFGGDIPNPFAAAPADSRPEVVAEVTPDPAPFTAEAMRLADSPDFRFILARGGFFTGKFEIVAVSADGSCIRVGRPSDFAERPDTRRDGLRPRVKYGVNAADVIRLREKLAALDFPGLARKYRNTRVCDGTQWGAVLVSGGKTKTVYCDNLFPPEMEAIAAFVDTVMVPPGDAVEPVELLSGRSREEDEVWDAVFHRGEGR